MGEGEGAAVVGGLVAGVEAGAGTVVVVGVLGMSWLEGVRVGNVFGGTSGLAGFGCALGGSSSSSSWSN